jgi:glucokinase
MTATNSSASATGTDEVVLAVDVGGSAVKHAFAAANGASVQVTRTPLDPSARGSDAAAAVVDIVHRALSQAPPSVSCHQIGLVIPGIVDPEGGVGRYSVMLGWRDAPLRDMIERRCGLPVAVGHDVGAAALAEQEWGAARGHSHWLFLALGTGLGTAMMLEGRPYRGHNNWGGELAHVKVEPEGPTCPCGKTGCAETLFSGRGLALRYFERTGHHASVPEILERAESGEAAARQVWDRAVAALVLATTNAADSLNPSCIVVGGGLAAAGEALFAPLRAGLQDLVRFVEPVPELLPAALGADAGSYGAGLLAWRALNDRRSDVS